MTTVLIDCFPRPRVFQIFQQPIFEAGLFSAEQRDMLFANLNEVIDVTRPMVEALKQRRAEFPSSVRVIMFCGAPPKNLALALETSPLADQR